MFGLYAMDGTPAVRRGRAARPGPRPVRQEDVEVARQRGRPAGLDRRATAPTRSASPSPAAPTRAPTCRSARSGCQGSRNFCNKLWNATRFALMNGAHGRGRRCRRPSELSTVDRWILARLEHVDRRGRRALRGYEFAKVCDALYHFAWDEVCDWYVELAKPVLAAGGDGGRRHPAGARPRAGRAAAAAAPGVPFVTEELWTALTGGETVVIAAWPAGRPGLVDDAAEARGRPRSSRWSPRSAGSAPTRACGPASGSPPGSTGLDGAGLAAHEPLIRSLARLDAAGRRLRGHRDAAGAGGVTVELDTRGTIDVAAERARLTKDRAAAEKEVAQAAGEARQRGVPRQGAGAGGRQDPRPARRGRGRPDPHRRPALDGAARRDRPHRSAERPTAASTSRRASRPSSDRWRGFTRMDFDLDRIEALLDLLGSPQRAYPAIHLTGTNGKTSTARMIDALLRGVRAAHRPVHQPAPADRPASGSASTASRSARSGSSTTYDESSRSSSWSTQRAGRAADVLRGDHRDGVRRVRRRAGRRRGRRGRAGRRRGRHQRDRRPASR